MSLYVLHAETLTLYRRGHSVLLLALVPLTDWLLVPTRVLCSLTNGQVHRQGDRK